MPVATTTALLIGGAAIAGGAAASSMGSGGGKVKAPAAQSPEELGRDSLEAQIALAPDVYRTEAQYRPLYAALDSNILNDTLFGGTVQQPGQFSSSAYLEQNPAVRTAWQQATATRDARGKPITPKSTQSLEQFAQAHWAENGRVGGLTPGQSVQTPGLLDMVGRAGTVLGQQQIDANRMQRTADIADVAALGGQAQAAYRSANPQLTGLMDQMAAKAMNTGGSSASGMQQQGPRQMPVQSPSAPNLPIPSGQFGAGINAPETGPFPVAASQPASVGAQGPMVAPQMRDQRAIPAQQVGPGGGLTAPVVAPTNMQAAQIGLAERLTAPQVEAERLGPLGQLSAPQISVERLGPLGELQASQINTRTQSGLLDGLNSAAQADLGLGGALNFAQSRMAQQSVRAAMGARGLNASTPAMFAEGLAALDYGRGLQNERRAFASNVEQANQGASAQTLARDQFNAGNQMRAGEFNLAQALQAGMANQNAANQTNQFNAGNQMQAGQFNLAQALQAGMANQNAANQTAQFNAGNQMQAGQFNIGNQLDVARFNAGNEMQAGMANQNAANQTAQFNAGNQMQAGQFNLAQAMQAQLANQAAGNQMAQFNQANAMDRERFNIANDIEAQRFNLGFGMQQQESDRAYQMNVANMLAAQAQDPFQMVLGRSAVPGAGMAVAQNNLGRTSLPQMFNPWDSSIMGIYSGNQANQLAAATATANNRAAQNSAMMGMLGTLGGAAIMACWVARECYGEHNPTWMRFRTWLMERAPERRRAAYLARGPHIARWLSTRPDWAARVRRWMDGVLAADDLLQLATA